MHLLLIIVYVDESLAYPSECAQEQLPVLIVHSDPYRHLDPLRVRLIDLVQQALLPDGLLAAETADSRETKVFIGLPLLGVRVVGVSLSL
jgi:hypothetical protein